MLPSRRRPAHPTPVEPWNAPTLIFVTVCTARRNRILGTSRATSIVLSAWSAADAWLVGRYVILPDHVHLFCAPRRSEFALDAWVRFWKSTSTRQWRHREQLPLWQSGFWDTQLRRGESYQAKWEYVRANPVRHGLVKRPEDWPYAGEMHALSWDGP